MTERRPHSRSGPAAGQSAAAGARDLADAVRDAAAEQQHADEHEHVDAVDTDTQAFAGTGQFTGRPVPTQEPVPEDGGAYHRPTGVPAEALEVVTRERDEYRSDLQRLAAEFDNFRKRAAREREQAASGAEGKLLGELIGVLDDFERALDQPDAQGSALAEGIGMTHQRLMAVLKSHGLEEVEADGQFDPHLHEALLQQPQAGVAEGQILSVVSRGWRLGDRVIRHSKVIVAGPAH